eukprot:EG_transcript_21342
MLDLLVTVLSVEHVPVAPNERVRLQWSYHREQGRSREVYVSSDLTAPFDESIVVLHAKKGKREDAMLPAVVHFCVEHVPIDKAPRLLEKFSLVLPVVRPTVGRLGLLSSRGLQFNFDLAVSTRFEKALEKSATARSSQPLSLPSFGKPPRRPAKEDRSAKAAKDDLPCSASAIPSILSDLSLPSMERGSTGRTSQFKALSELDLDIPVLASPSQPPISGVMRKESDSTESSVGEHQDVVELPPRFKACRPARSLDRDTTTSQPPRECGCVVT